MLIGDVMDDLSTALKTAIPELNTHAYWAKSIVAPAAVIAWPDTYNFDKTMVRGADELIIPVILLVGRAESLDTRDRMSQYASGSGTSSVKQILEGATFTSCDSVRVQTVEFSVMTVAGTDYLAGTFNTHVIGKGN